MDIKKNDTYEYREVVKRPNLRVNLLEIGYCTEKVLFNELKEPFSGRLYFTTDTNKFYFDWKKKRHELDVYGDGGSGSSDMSIMEEIEKIKNGAGLDEDGTYTPDSTTNYLTEASSLKDADKKLDTKVKNIEDNLFEVTDLKYMSDNTPTSIRTVVDDNNKLNLVIDTTDSVNSSNPLTTKTYVDSKSTLSPEQIEDIQEQVIENIDDSLFEVTDLKYMSDNTPTSIRTVVDDNNKLNLVIDTTDSVNSSNPLTTKTYVDSKTGALSPEQIEDIQEQVIGNIEENLLEVTDLKYMSDNTPTSIRTVVDDNNKLNLVIDTTDSVNQSNPLTTKTYVDSKTGSFGKYYASVGNRIYYKTCEGLYAAYDELMELYPNFITKNDLGVITIDETESYHMYEYVLTDGNYNRAGVRETRDTEIAKPIYGIVTGIHGNERSSVNGLYYIIKDMLSNASPLSPVYGGMELHIVPIGCPWGFQHDSRTNQNGVNINRNFATSSWSETGSGTGDYSGTSAASEPETQILQTWINTLHTNGCTFIFDWHNSGYNSEISCMMTNTNNNDILSIKDKYVKSANSLAPILMNTYGAKNTCIWGYCGHGTSQGMAAKYMDEQGQNGCYFETSNKVNTANTYQLNDANCGATVMGNVLVELL